MFCAAHIAIQWRHTLILVGLLSMLINLPHFREDFSVFDFHFVNQLKTYFQLLGMDRNRNKMLSGVRYFKSGFTFLLYFQTLVWNLWRPADNRNYMYILKCAYKRVEKCNIQVSCLYLYSWRLPRVGQSALNHCTYRVHWPRSLRRESTVARLLGLRVRIPPASWMSISCQCGEFTELGVLLLFLALQMVFIYCIFYT